MRTLCLAILGIGLGACNGESGPVDTGEGPDTDDTDTDGYPSSFEHGRYRLTEFVLLSSDEGKDHDGDGEVDNNLPNALKAVDSLIKDEDLTREGLNERIADSIATGELVILLEATHDGTQLTLDVLAGLWDAEAGTYTVDAESSYDASGEPLSRLLGAFSSETAFEAGPGRVEIPVTFYAEEPPIPVPLEEATVEGDFEATTSAGRLYGIIPAQELVDEVIEPLIPDEGYDSDGDGDIDYTKEQIMSFVNAAAESENTADQELSDGRRGISAAFRYEAEALDW